MKKVVCVLASPRANSSSSQLALHAAQAAKDSGSEVVIYRLNDMNFKGCQACRYCKDNESYCIVEDDLMPYWKDLDEADGLIIAIPNYAGHPTGPSITYMNRHYCLIDADHKPRIHPGIKVLGIFSQGNSDTATYEEAYQWYLADFERREMKLVDTIVHSAREELTDDSATMQRAYAAGKQLGE